MNILLSADCFYPAQVGGPANTIYWQATALARAGHAVTVVATSQALPREVVTNQWVQMDCGRVMYTRNPHFYWPVRHIWQGWRAMQKADVVQVNSFFYPASLVWVLTGRLLGKPVVWSPHGELNPVALRFHPRRKRLVLAVVRLLNPAVHFHATSEIEADHIRQQVGPKVAVTTILSRMDMPILLTPKLDAAPYLLFMGRIHPIKAIDRLITALGASAVFRESAYTLLIAGPLVDEFYANQLYGLINTLGLSEKITFLGLVEGERKQQIYANARLTILPSHAENFGNVVIESLAQGTPVLTSINTPWQLLQTERAGSWVANDPESLRQVIETYLTMPANEYAGYRRRAHALAHNRFDSRDSVSEWEGLYANVQQWSTQRNHESAPNAIEFHDRMATEFNQKYDSSSAFRERLQVFTNLFNQYIVPGNSVMDIGCGTGIFSTYLARKGCEVTGIDGSEAMIALAEQKDSSGRVRYVVQSLPLPDVTDFTPQDVVLMSSFLEYVDDLNAMLMQAHALLKPGGLLIISMPNRRSVYRLSEHWLFRLTARPRYVGHVRHVVTEVAFTSRLELVGFTALTVAYFSGTDPVSAVLKPFLGPSRVNTLFVGVYQKNGVTG